MKVSRRAGGILVVLAVLTLVAAACSNNDDNSGASGSAGGSGGAPITGAGSTFAQPMYQTWGQGFLSVQPNTKLNYQGIGSGGGIEQFTAKTVDFGATDVPLQDDEIAALPSKNYIEFPTCLGAVVFAYNLPDVTTPLKLDGSTIADIFLGKITKWNDPAIAGQNSGVTLPDTDITVVHRADESGTTAVWTGWLSDESATWKSQVGADKAVEWPVGNAGNGNDGVAALISQSEGAAGYLSYDFAVTAKLGIASIKAPDGQYVAPSIDSISKAGGGLTFPITPTTNILNSSTSGAYPIASTTYVLMYTEESDQATAQALVDFWTWALSTGQSSTTQINYAPLPAEVASAALNEVKKVTVNGTAITPTTGG
jgi:phosphate transport system substrate-binding protein